MFELEQLFLEQETIDRILYPLKYQKYMGVKERELWDFQIQLRSL